MAEWTPEASEYLEGYLRQVGALARNQGEDGEEIKAGLKEHIAVKLHEIGGIVVSLDVLRRVLAEVGSPEQILASDFGPARSVPNEGRTAKRDLTARVLRWTIALGLMLVVGVLALSVLSTIAAVVLPTLSRSRASAAHGMVRENLERIAAAEERFRTTASYDADGDGEADYGTLEQLHDRHLLPPGPYDVKGETYTYQLTIEGSASSGGADFRCVATPAENLKDVYRPWRIDRNGVASRFDPSAAEPNGTKQ